MNFIPHPGPQDKQGYPDAPERTSRVGMVLHSAEGSLASALGVLASALGVLDGPRTVSWHFTACKDGRIFEHYDLASACWHAGRKAANLSLVGVEHEGVAGEVVSGVQLQASADLVRWVAAQEGWTPTRGLVGRTLFEHNELNATSCPSHRIPWPDLMALVEGPPQEPPMSDQQKIDLEVLTANARFLKMMATPMSGASPIGRYHFAPGPQPDELVLKVLTSNGDVIALTTLGGIP